MFSKKWISIILPFFVLDCSSVHVAYSNFYRIFYRIFWISEKLDIQIRTKLYDFGYFHFHLNPHFRILQNLDTQTWKSAMWFTQFSYLKLYPKLMVFQKYMFRADCIRICTKLHPKLLKSVLISIKLKTLTNKFWIKIR